jgi:hypothetical protein
MITQNTNFKTISGKTQNYDLFKKILLKSIISLDSIYLFKPEVNRQHFFADRTINNLCRFMYLTVGLTLQSYCRGWHICPPLYVFFYTYI